LIGTVIAAGRQEAAPASVQKPAEPAATAVSPGKPHTEIPDTEGTTCLTCHEELGKSKVMHAPVSSGMCTSCHEFSGKGEETRVAFVGGATAENNAGLCVTCHEGVGTALKAQHGHAPLADGNCSTCHDPHGSEEPKQLKAKQSELCGTCHDGVAADTKKKVPHAPAAQQCSACHEPHGGPRDTLLREDVNTVCLGCHGGPLPLAEQPPTFLGRAVSSAMAGIVRPRQRIVLDGLQRRGHPTVTHPVRGSKDPLNPSRPFTCISCHVPHGGDHKALSRFEGQSASDFCVKCHT
jgi:predicted CXXCH cytochrome family protein